METDIRTVHALHRQGGPRSSYEGWKPESNTHERYVTDARDLPMRDGNQSHDSTKPARQHSPRSSYEGWKLMIVAIVSALQVRPRSSYEGWKLHEYLVDLNATQAARDLPMRDGN